MNPLETPALAWMIEAALIQTKTGHAVAVSGGMGIETGAIVLPEGGAERDFVQALLHVQRNPVKTWRGLDVRHIHGSSENIVQFDVLAALDAATKRVKLTQQQFDFLTLADVKGAIIDSMLVAQDIPSLFDYDPERIRLISAFRDSLVAEAAPHAHKVAVGAYVLAYTPLPALDAEIAYETLRLLITPRGIFCTIVYQSNYAPFFWSPDGINTSQVYVHPRGVFALEALLAGIWRDACIVREKWHEATGGKRGGVTTRQPEKKQGALVLPRTVYVSQWGSGADRELVHRAAPHAHTVRGFYRVLPEGQQSHGADERAAEFGYPAPPDGYTFVRPHTRGEGDVRETARRIVCKGLQTISILFG